MLFGGVSSSTDLQVISDTHVQVRTPAHPLGGSYVQVVRPDATSAKSSAAVYDYVAKPAPLRLGPEHTRAAGGGSGLSCASASLCLSAGIVAEDRGGQVWGVELKNGSTWGRPKAFSHSSVTGVSCVLSPRRTCTTVGTDGYASRWLGGRWIRTKVAPANPSTSLLDVSCATSSFCQAVTGNGNAYRWNGTRWSGPTHLTAALASVSCPTTRFCYAVGQDRVGVRWIGSRWVAAHPIAATGAAHSISCSSATFCMAAGSFPGGNRIVFTGVAWGPPNSDHFDFSGTSYVDVTCTGPLFCVTPNGDFEEDYNYATYNGDVTSVQVPFETPISCWAAYQCLMGQGTSWRYVTKG